MHTERTLAVLDSRLESRLSRLKYLYRSSGTAYTPEVGRMLAYIVMETMNCWVLFSRSFIVSSALGARTRNNGNVTSMFNRRSSANDVIIQATFTESPWLGRRGRPTQIDRRQEPAWHDPAVIMRLSSALLLSNDSTITQALSLGATFARDLPPIRNYFAHKNEDSAERVRRIGRQYGISAYAGSSLRKKTPALVITSSAPGRPQSILADWLDELETTASLIVD
jgi:hypothetical protein